MKAGYFTHGDRRKEDTGEGWSIQDTARLYFDATVMWMAWRVGMSSSWLTNLFTLTLTNLSHSVWYTTQDAPHVWRELSFLNQCPQRKTPIVVVRTHYVVVFLVLTEDKSVQWCFTSRWQQHLKRDLSLWILRQSYAKNVGTHVLCNRARAGALPQ